LKHPDTEKLARLIELPAGSDHGWLGHQGSIPGYNTEVQYPPSLRATIVVLVNTDIANASLVNPAPAILQALARVITPQNIPAG
jgi:D-alanyl-D-alanine carboxypeptidase